MKLSVMILACAAIVWAQPPNATVPPGPPPPPAVTNPDEVVLTVGDRKITAAQYQELVKVLLPPQTQAIALGAGRRQFAQRLAEVLVLAAEGEKLHLDKNPNVAPMLEFQANSRLATAMFLKLEQELVVSDAEIQTYYDAHKADYEVLNARQILIHVKGAPGPPPPGKPELSDEEARTKAEAIRKRIVDGEDFAAVAKAESDEAAQKAGNPSELKRGTMVPQLEQAAFALKAGEISQPVRAPDGYHIIQVQSRSTKPLADVKQDVVAHLRPTLAPKLVEDLVDKTGYHLDDKFFGAAPPARPPVTPPTTPIPAPPGK